MSLKQPSLVVRAFSPDNDRHVRSIIDLFTRAYGDDYPLQNVYRPQFWKAHIGHRFTSLVAILDGVSVAHLAIHPHQHNSTTFQLAYPVLDPDAIQYRDRISQSFIEVVKKQISRHKWKVAIDLKILSHHFKSNFLSPLLSSTEVAIIPAYFNAPTRISKENSINRLNLLVRQNVIDSNKTEIKLSVPSDHVEITQQLFSSLNLNRKLVTTKNSADMQALTVSADQRPWYMNYYPAHKVTHLFVQPSLIQREHTNLLRKIGGNGKTIAAFINMRDPQCASFCETLEELDFKYSGVMTCFHERENIIYTRPSEFILDFDEISGERAKALAHYMENYNWKAALPYLKSKDGYTTKNT